MSENFSKELSKIKAPHVVTPKHKRKLKNAVLSVYLNKGKSPKGSSLFDDFKNMSLKKLIPAGVLAVFVFTLVGQNFMSWRNTVYAQELIEETIQKIESQPLDEKEIMSTIQILEELKKEGEIKYLGEEPYSTDTENGPERKIEKFSFTSNDLSSDLILHVVDQKRMRLIIDNPLQQSTYEDFEVKIDNDSQIVNLEELKAKLKDPNLKKSWLKEFIKMENKNWIESNQKDLVPPLESIKNSNLSQPEKQRIIDGHKKCDQQTKKIVEQLEPLLKEAEVLIKEWNEGCADSAFWIFLLPISNQQEKTKESQVEIQKLIDKLNQFDTDSARMKIKILEHALSSKRLRSYSNDNTFFSFPYTLEAINQKLDLAISINPDDETEDFIHIGFHPASFYSESPSMPLLFNQMQWVDVRLENGKISNGKDLKVKLKDVNLKDETLLYLIKAQNQALLDEIMKNEVEQPIDEYGPLIFKKYEKEGKAELKLELLKQLKEIVKDAEVPIIQTNLVRPQIIDSNVDWPIGDDQDPNVLYSLGIYPLGNPQLHNSSEAVEKLDEIIENLKGSINSENAATLEILTKALEAKDLKYEGETESWDDNKPVKAQKVSFKNELYANNVSIIIHPDGEILFSMNPEKYGNTERFNIEFNDQFEVTNLEEFEEKLKDPELTEEWLKELVKMHNSHAISIPFDPNTSPFNTMEPKDKKEVTLCSEASKKIMEQLSPIIKNAEVSIQGNGITCGEKTSNVKSLADIEFGEFSFDLFPITKNKAK